MMKISRSPERYTFQKDSYIARCEEKDEEISESYLQMYESYKEQHDRKFDNPESRINNLEYDLLTTDWILEKTRQSEVYAQNLYASMCNRDFVKNDGVAVGVMQVESLLTCDKKATTLTGTVLAFAVIGPMMKK